MTQLNDYFHCDAYENNNSVYVLDNNGFKLFNANDTELLKGHNVYTVLSQMSYLHGSSFAATKGGLPAQAPVIPTPYWTGLSITTP